MLGKRDDCLLLNECMQKLSFMIRYELVCVSICRSLAVSLILFRDIAIREPTQLGVGDKHWMANTGGTRMRTRNVRNRRSMLYALGQVEYGNNIFERHRMYGICDCKKKNITMGKHIQVYSDESHK